MWKKVVKKYRAKLQEKLHKLMKEIDNLNEEEKMYSDKEIKPEYITSEELEEFSKRLSNRLNVKNLILYHTEESHGMKRKRLYIQEGKENFKGNIYVPDELETIEL